MPTTVVEFAERTYSDRDYQSRLRRPVWLEGLGFTPVIYRPPPTATVFKPSPPATVLPPEPPPTEYVPSTYQEPPADVELEPQGGPVMPTVPPPRKATSPWVWVAGGTGAVVVFWLFFRRKRKG